MNRVSQAEALDHFRLKVLFADGFSAVIDLKSHIGAGFTSELLDPARFAEVGTEPGGGIAWPNGFDICPEFLRELAEKRQVAA